MNPARPRPAWAAPLLLLAVAALLRSLYLVHINLDADMAVTGLMGRHILEGHFPIFFYGQPFCGAIEAYVAAPIFALLGSSPLTLCLAPTLLGLIFVLVTYLAASDMWGRRAGLWAMAFAALPPHYFAVHSVLPRAAYIEIPLLSLLLIWMAFRLVHRQRPWWLYLCYGLAAGLGLWTHFLIVFALLATALYMVLLDWRLLLRRGHALIWLGFTIGGLPLWIYNLGHHWYTFTYLLEPKESFPPGQVLAAFWQKAAPILLGVFWDGHGEPMAPVLSHLVYGLGLAALAWLVWQRRRGLWSLARADRRGADGSELMLLMLLMVLAVTVLKGEAVGSTRRHYVPIYAALIPLAGYAAARLQAWKAWPAYVLAGLALGSNLAGVLATSPVLNSALRHDAQGQAQSRRLVIERALALGVTRAWSFEYWSAPLITFESGERLLLTRPNIPPDHFYGPNYLAVARSGQAAFLCSREANSVRDSLKAMAASFNEERVGPYTIFYGISPPAEALLEEPSQGWRATASEFGEDAALALDQDALTRWSPLAPQRRGQYLELDLGREVPDLCMVRLASGRPDDQPRQCSVYLSRDGANWRRVVKLGLVEWPLFWAAGQPQAPPDIPRLDLRFAPQAARFVRVVQTGGTEMNYWSVQEISLYRAAPPTPPSDPAAALEFARRQGARRLYAEAGLRAFVPTDLAPLPQPAPVNSAWPMDLDPRDVLPSDLTGVVVAVEAKDGDRLEGFLRHRRAGFQRGQAGGYSLFWGLEPPPGQDHRLPREGVALRSSQPGREGLALDRDPKTRWDTGRPMRAGDYFELRLPVATPLGGLEINDTLSPNDLPRGLKLDWSPDGEQWRELAFVQEPRGAIVFGGDRLMGAQAGRLRLVFNPVRARYLRLTLTQGHPRAHWSIHELTLLGAAEAPAGS